MGLSRQNDAWSDAQVARNVKESVLRQLGQPGPDEPIYMISGEAYFLRPTNEWAYSSSSMQVIDNRVDTQIRLRQPLGALREVSYQLFAGDQILASAFEERQDMLCVPRQLAELLKLPLQEVMEDFNSICPGNWQQRGVSPAEIRTFCVWRNAPMFYVDCRGRLLDCFQPAEKEEKAVAFTSWNGHAFFYRSARAVAACDESEQRQRFRRLKRDNPVPEFKEWQLWEGEIKSGYFYTEDLRGVRAQLLAEGHQPKVSMRGLCEWSALRLRVVGGRLRDSGALRGRAGAAAVDGAPGRALSGTAPRRGQPGGVPAPAAGRREDTRSRREELLARQQGMCKLCGAPIAMGTFEIDHVIPVAQSFSGQQQELQALCLECHRTKTSLEGNHSTTLESRFCRYVYQNYAATPRLPPLVFQLQKWDDDRPCQGIDVCRCRKNGLANARFPLPVFCPLDCILPTEEGQLADLTWVEMPCDHRKGVLDRLPYVGRQARLRLPAGSGWPSGSTSSGAWTPQRTSTGPAAHGAQLARGRGALRQAGHQQPGGPVRSESGIDLFHEDFKPSGRWGGVQLAPDLHGCGREDADWGRQMLQKNGQHSVPRQPPSEGRLKGIPPRHRGLAGLARLQSPPISWRAPRCLANRREASSGVPANLTTAGG